MYFFHGLLAEVAVWNVARSEAEIKANMSQKLTGNEANLVGYWPLSEVKQEGSTVKVADQSSNNFEGTVYQASVVEESSLPWG
jgi:hypothetical protein